MEVKNGGRVGCEISQAAKFYRLQNFATLQDFYSGPFFFSLWLQFPSDFNRALRVRLGFFMFGLTRKFWPY